MTDERHSMTCRYLHCRNKFRVSSRRDKYCSQKCGLKAAYLRLKMEARVKGVTIREVKER